MALAQDEPGCHHTECWLYQKNKVRSSLYQSLMSKSKAYPILQEIVGLSSCPQPNLHCHYNYRPIYTMRNDAEDCDMSEYSNNWNDFLYPSANPPPSPQTDPIRESPDRNDASGYTVPTDSGRIDETARIIAPPQIASFDFALPGPVIDMQEAYSTRDEWNFPHLQNLSASSSLSFNPSMPPNFSFGEPYLREVRLHRFKF
jgi:hypothetical protein